MKIKNKKQFKNSKLKISPILLLVVFALSFQLEKIKKSNAETSQSITEISNGAQQDENQEKLEELERRARVYREIIDIKRKQQNTLSSQLSSVDTQIQQVEAEIELNKRKIAELDEKIKNLQQQIDDKAKTLELQKILLTDLMQAYYENTQQSTLQVVFTSENFASFMSHKNQLAQASDRIKELSESVKSLREKLIADRTELEKSRLDVVNTHYDLKDKNQVLEETQDQKKTLLAQTKGEEARYQDLLARVEQQKLELLDIDELYATSGLSLDDFPKPDSSLYASMDWFYSQRDPKWGNTTIGNSSSTLKSWGCAVASVAMVETKHGDRITPQTLAKKPIFSFDLISWSMDKWDDAKITLNSSYGTSHGNISWSVIDSEIKKGNPVIVYIKKTNGKGGHYVVVHNKDPKTKKYVVHDPYFGANIFLDTSRALVGGMGVASGTVVDQMIVYN